MKYRWNSFLKEFKVSQEFKEGQLRINSNFLSMDSIFSLSFGLFYEYFLSVAWKQLYQIIIIWSSLRNISWNQNILLVNKKCFISYVLLVYLQLNKKQGEHLSSRLILFCQVGHNFMGSILTFSFSFYQFYFHL